MKKKNNKIIFIICSVITILAAAIIGFIIGNEMLLKENNKTSNIKDEQVEEKNMPLDEANKILEKFGLNKNFGCQTIVDSNYNDTFKALVAIDNLDETLIKEEDCSNYYNEKIESYIPNTTIFKGNIGQCRNKTKVIDYNEINKVYKKLYDEEMPKNSINAMNLGNLYYDLYYYDAEKNIFIEEQPSGVGGTCASSHIREIKDAKIIDDTLKINFYDFQTQYYNEITKSYYLKTNGIIKNITCSSQEECVNIIKTEYMDKLPEYQVTFELKNGDYVFKNLIRVLS